MLCRSITLAFILVLSLCSYGQTIESREEIDTKSFRLYSNEQWQQLLDYGKIVVNHKQDFILLRLRLGYAAFMLSKYSEAIRHYNAILKKDAYNETARYYKRICLQYLQQSDLALYQNRYIPTISLKNEKVKKIALTGADWEGSYKTTDLTTRFDAMYHRIGLRANVGWRWSMYNMIGFFQQKLDEPGLKMVVNNRSIQINQTDFYHLSTINLLEKLQLKAGYHFINTPFSNFKYQNHIGIIGLKYSTPYIQLQASVYSGKLIDSAVQQINIQASYYPMGNANIYGMTTVSFGEYGMKQQMNIKQVIGCKLTSKIWAEGNVTLGKFQNYLENDGLYVYNAIDPNMKKMGGSIYYTLNNKVVLQGGYTFEEKNLYTYPNLLFYQHSINGGIKWTF